jgi:nitrogen-specific signal transduction histidine kinase
MSRRELARPDPLRLLNALPQPLLALDAHGSIVEVNTAAETFFEMGRGALGDGVGLHVGA